MAQWKKIITSGSDGLNISALNMTLGADAPGNVNLLASTTVQDAISQLNNVVGLIAPSAPSGLSATGFGNLLVSNNFSARNQSFVEISSLTTDTTPQIQATDFFDGGSGTLSASISTDGGSSFSEIDPGKVESMRQVIIELALGMSTALLTTLCGLVASLFIKIQVVMQEQDDV